MNTIMNIKYRAFTILSRKIQCGPGPTTDPGFMALTPFWCHQLYKQCLLKLQRKFQVF